jgi:hypothetical protein
MILEDTLVHNSSLKMGLACTKADAARIPHAIALEDGAKKIDRQSVREFVKAREEALPRRREARLEEYNREFRKTMRENKGADDFDVTFYRRGAEKWDLLDEFLKIKESEGWCSEIIQEFECIKQRQVRFWPESYDLAAV